MKKSSSSAAAAMMEAWERNAKLLMGERLRMIPIQASIERHRHEKALAIALASVPIIIVRPRRMVDE